MGRFSNYSGHEEVSKKQVGLHPVWRGIGFAMMLLIPFLSYVGALAFLQENNKSHWIRIPADLYVSWSDPLILVKALLTIAIAFVLYMIFSFVTFLLYRMIAPPRYGPLDVPPVAYRGKKNVR